MTRDSLAVLRAFEMVSLVAIVGTIVPVIFMSAVLHAPGAPSWVPAWYGVLLNGFVVAVIVFVFAAVGARIIEAIRS